MDTRNGDIAVLSEEAGVRDFKQDMCLWTLSRLAKTSFVEFESVVMSP